MDTLGSKLIAMVVLAIASLFLGLIPIRLKKYLPQDNTLARVVTSVLLCFGGGVLFSVCFTHILPEVRENFEMAGKDFDEKPISEIIFCAGFFLIYLIEELVHKIFDKHTLEKDQDHVRKVHRAFSIHSMHYNVDLNELKQLQRTYGGNQLEVPVENYDHQEPHTRSANNVRKKSESSTTQLASNAELQQHYNTFEVQSVDSSSENKSTKPFLSASSLRDFITIVALSLHSVFEGLAVGLEESKEDVWQLFVAVATHKFVISFSVGLELATSGTRTALHVMYMTTWALASPIGIAIGIAISEGKGEYNYTTNAVLQGLAGGTILYVVVFEVLGRERCKDISGIIQFLAVVVGFVAMMSVDLFAGHHHDHSGGGTTTLNPNTSLTYL